MSLTPKIRRTQLERLIEELAVGFTPSSALMHAGIPFTSAREKLAELKEAHPWFKDTLELRVQEAAQEQVISQERVLHEIAAVGFSDIGDYHTPDGAPRKFKDIPPHARRAMKKVVTQVNANDEREVTQYELHPKMDALLQLGRYFSMFTDKVDHTGEISIKEETDARLINRTLELCRKAGISLADTGAGEKVIDQAAFDVLSGDGGAKPPPLPAAP